MKSPPDRPPEGTEGCPDLLLPALAFPPYRFVPGAAPHPYVDPKGYAYGRRPPDPPFVEQDRWAENEAYLRGLDFFNRGWWWEAHEVWEGAWHACEGRDAVQRSLFVGLIQLAACALNRERGHDDAAQRLLDTARQHLRQAAGPGGRICGLDLSEVCAEASRLLGAATARVEGLYLRPRTCA